MRETYIINVDNEELRGEVRSIITSGNTAVVSTPLWDPSPSQPSLTPLKSLEQSMEWVGKEAQGLQSFYSVIKVIFWHLNLFYYFKKYESLRRPFHYSKTHGK